MSAPGRPARPLLADRDLSALLDDTFGLYRRHLGVVLLLAACVVIPVELLVSGIGLGQLTGSYDTSPSTGETLFGSGVTSLVTTPLVTGMLVKVLLDDAAGRPVSAGAAGRTGLDAFAPLLGTVVLAGIGIVLGLAAFVVPGIFLAVRWFVAAPAVVVEGRAPTDALRRSWDLVTGHGWWVLGVVIVVTLLAGVLSLLVSLPFGAAADAADSQAVALVGTTLAEVVALPFTAIATTLAYFTLRARHGERAGEGEGGAPPVEEPPPPAGPGGWEPPVPPR
ncbi:MAG: glycerophosphoryl diester phosphodiesterase membrane domain-containing protein [Solirubrobacterales bacterium]|nr:glycerophosphoryl diester phosphodiesterase membrane domain-containing protein [Solirubrobacterales bacterium]